MDTLDAREARLARIWVFPIKSLDGVCVDEATFNAGGGLVHDRRWALRTPEGETINGKREPRVHGIRAHFDLQAETAELSHAGDRACFSLAGDVAETADIARWLSAALARPVTLVRNDEGMPDDRDNPGPTVISEASLQTTASWFDGLDAAAMERRLRSNLVITGVPPFWEDGLLSRDGVPVPFSVGEASLLATNPCQRCVVPTRDPESGEPLRGFQKTLMRMRNETLPEHAPRSRFNHFYRLALNTRPAASTPGMRIAAGDPVSISRSARNGAKGCATASP